MVTRCIDRKRPVTLFIPALLLIMITSSLSGCVYLRLLEFKRQLADFDRYFRIEVRDDFTLLFKKPMLIRGDFDYLTKLHASRIEPLPKGKRIFYEFKKIDSEGRIVTPPVDIRFILNFNQEDFLTSWTYSPIFLAMVPPEFLEISLRSLGDSQINRFQRQVRADLSSIGQPHTHLPTKSDIESVLGTPLQVIQRETEERLLYRFELKTDQVEDGYEDRRFTLVKLDFDSSTAELLKMSGRFVGMKISIDYRTFRRSKG